MGFLDQLETGFLGSLAGGDGTLGGKDGPLLRGKARRRRIALRISTINVDRDATMRFGLSGGDVGCNGNQQEGKEGVGNAIHDKWQVERMVI